MIIPAKRVNSINEYYFSHKLREIARRNASGEDIINLGIGNPDLLPSDSTIETLQVEISKTDSHGYQPYKGIDELRNAFSSWYKSKFKVDLNPETEILPLIGSKEGILHISMAFLNPGDKVLIPDPGYPTYKAVSELIGATPLIYKLEKELNWLPNLGKLSKLDLSGVKLMWVNYPNMPTGAQINKEGFKKLLDFARSNNIVICNDNPYSFILNEKPLSILSIPGAKEIAIELNSLSKSHNMAGWRIGMLASNTQFIQYILKVKSNMDSGIFKPLQKAAAKALNNPDFWYQNLNHEYAERQKIGFEILDILKCNYQINQVGMFIWAEIPNSVYSSESYAEHILNKAKVFITPGFIFGVQGERYIRISLSNSREKLLLAKSRILLNI
ncbi:MAG: aminotransferase class I/II-fold pyridoxal phosphate-dependent enzyme [Bacteroidetes bacterium]|nr:aminotransferase class I/II-fold pyridoxal phosphate-dependent enzyme [Bacteroidota bacterium]